MNNNVLILNASYEPLNAVTVTRAMNLIVSEKAVTIETDGEIFHSIDDVFEVPTVLLLKTQVAHNRRAIKGFSKRLVLARDNHTCVYCSKHATTIDHVFPRAKGGQDLYENCVASCVKCNSHKGSKTLEQLGWKVPFIPKAPSPYSILLNKAPARSHKAEVWKKYISNYE